MLNRVIKLVIALAWYGIVSVLNKIKKNKIGGHRKLTILTYHGISKEQAIQFEKQMRTLVKIGYPAATDATSSKLMPGNNVAVSFDDGYEDIMENALPVLRELHIPSTVFMTAGNMGRSPDWIEKSAVESRESTRLMDEKQLASLDENLIAIGSHGISHRKLTLLDRESVMCELIESKAILEKCLGRPVSLFAFPYGAYADYMVTLGMRAGYRFTYGNIPSPTEIRDDQPLRPRVALSPADWKWEYSLKMMGGYDWLPVAISIKCCLKYFFSLGKIRPGHSAG